MIGAMLSGGLNDYLNTDLIKSFVDGASKTFKYSTISTTGTVTVVITKSKSIDSILNDALDNCIKIKETPNKITISEC